MANKKEPKYNKGDKFTIEIAEIHTHYDDNNKPYNVYRVKGFNSLFLDEYALDKLGKFNTIKTVEDMRKELENFCAKSSCIDDYCPLHTSEFECGRGKHFFSKNNNGEYKMSDNNIIAAYYKAFIEKEVQKPKPLNTKFVVTETDAFSTLTKGKIYIVSNGKFENDLGVSYPLYEALNSFEELERYLFSTSSPKYGGTTKIIEIKE